MAIAKESLAIGGLPVNVYSSGQSSTKDVVVFFLLHGRYGSAEDIDPIARTVIEQAQKEGQNNELFLVTFDQRNHGKRIVDPKANDAWNSKDKEKNNDRHAFDMYAIQTGTARDVSFLIDFLPPFLFPSDDRSVVEWGVAGISLGGHATWIALSQEPRITTGIPIIGCPDYLTLITQRAQRAQVPMQSPFVPDSFRALVDRVDPAATPFASLEQTPDAVPNPFLNKRILVLSGERDTLVPWSASRPFVESLQVGAGGVKRVSVQVGVGHECTEGMIREMSDFITEFCL